MKHLHIIGFAVIIPLFVMISGCLSPQASKVTTLAPEGHYIPREMEWLVTKMQANARVPWGIMGKKFSIDFVQGREKGEIEAQVRYQIDEDGNAKSELYSAIFSQLAYANNLLSAEYFPSEYGTRNILFIKVKPMAIGPEYDRIEDLKESF